MHEIKRKYRADEQSRCDECAAGADDPRQRTLFEITRAMLIRRLVLVLQIQVSTNLSHTLEGQYRDVLLTLVFEMPVIPEEVRDGIVALRWAQHGEIISVIEQCHCQFADGELILVQIEDFDHT